jgi:hypothetical protein
MKSKDDQAIRDEFDGVCAHLSGIPVTHIWRGYGSAIFIELGELKPGRLLRNGTPGNPKGPFSLRIEWSWRIEGKRRIWCGSWSDEERWPRAFRRLLGSTVSSISLFGRLPEIDIGLSNGLHVVSMMTAEGDPRWVLSERGKPGKGFMIKAGRLRMQPYS